MKVFLPALLLAVLSFFSGTFSGGASFWGAASTHVLVVVFALLGVPDWRDPLGLGRRGRWLVLAFVLAVGASWWLSPVSRAGFVALILLPAYLLLPAAVAQSWADARGRWTGLVSIGLVLGAVALVALARWQIQGSPRAAMPLGHHNLLSIWLLLIWPIGLVSMRRDGIWRVPLAIGGALGTLALTAAGSFLAACAFGVQVVVAAMLWKRARMWLVVALLVVWVGPTIGGRVSGWLAVDGAAYENAGDPRGVQPSLGRARRMLADQDSSVSARVVYARAGWEGIKERPAAGWGPGSVPWTLALFVEPVRGLNPASEVIGDLHSFPLQVTYETGFVGLVLLVVLLSIFGWRRVHELKNAKDPAVLEAALLGLGGGGLMLVGNAPLNIPGVLAPFVVVAGAALAGAPQRSISRRWKKAPLAAAGMYAIVAGCLLFPDTLAHFYYDQAASESDPRSALEQIELAAQLDPDFPLYRARAVWLEAELDGVTPELADRALRAAEDARELAPLWLAAGTLGLEVERPWAREAIQRALKLDPLSPIVAFHLLLAMPESSEAVDLGVAAVEGDSRLGAAVFWDEHPELRDAVLARLEQGSPGELAMRSARSGGKTAFLAQSMDRRTALSFSLFAFRRLPWPADLAPVEVWLERLPAGP